MLARPSSLARQVIGSAIEVHRVLGPGLLESIYERCLAHEFADRQIRFRRQIVVPIVYKELELEGLYRIDFIVHKAQTLSYMRLARVTQGMLINFNTAKLVDGLTNLLLPADQ